MMALGRIQQLLGGEPNTGPLHNEQDIVRLVRRGVPTRSVDYFLSAAHLRFSDIEATVLNRRTFKRRQDSAQTLDPAESDRLLRLVSMVAMADETFGSHDKAMIWLGRENRALNGETPLSMADTGQGARAVERLLGQIAYGLAA